MVEDPGAVQPHSHIAKRLMTIKCWEQAQIGLREPVSSQKVAPVRQAHFEHGQKAVVSPSIPVQAPRSEGSVWKRGLIAGLNDRSGEIFCIAANGVPQMRGIAARAIAARAKGGSVRSAVIAQTEMLRDARTAGLGKLRCGVA